MQFLQARALRFAPFGRGQLGRPVEAPQLVRVVPGQLLERPVEHREPAVRKTQPDGLRRALDHVREKVRPLSARGQRLLRLLPLGDVAAVDVRVFLPADRCDGDRKARLLQIHVVLDHPTLGDGPADQASQRLVGDRLADLAAPAGVPRRDGVPVQDGPVRQRTEDGVRVLVREPGKPASMLLAGAQGVGRPFQFDHFLLEARVGRVQLLVQALELLARRLHLLVRGLELLVDGRRLLVRRPQELVRLTELLDGAGQLLLGDPKVLLESADLGV